MAGYYAVLAVLLFQVCGKKISVRLKSEDWKEQIHREMKTSSVRPPPLFNTTTNSLLGESFDIPIMDNYDSEGKCCISYKTGHTWPTSEDLLSETSSFIQHYNQQSPR